MTDHVTPQLVQEFLSSAVLSVAVGPAHMIAIVGGGEVYSWGLSESGKLGLGPDSAPMYATPQKVDLPAALQAAKGVPSPMGCCS